MARFVHCLSLWPLNEDSGQAARSLTMGRFRGGEAAAAGTLVSHRLWLAIAIEFSRVTRMVPRQRMRPFYRPTISEFLRMLKPRSLLERAGYSFCQAEYP